MNSMTKTIQMAVLVTSIQREACPRSSMTSRSSQTSPRITMGASSQCSTRRVSSARALESRGVVMVAEVQAGFRNDAASGFPRVLQGRLNWDVLECGPVPVGRVATVNGCRTLTRMLVIAVSSMDQTRCLNGRRARRNGLPWCIVASRPSPGREGQEG